MPRKLTPEEVRVLKEYTRIAFETYDVDKSGQIEARECEQVIRQFNESTANQKKLDDATIKKAIEDFIHLADKNGDGKVNIEELYKYVLTLADACE